MEYRKIRKTSSKYYFLITSFIIILGMTFLFPKIAQPTWYHDFADKRVFLNIPYAMNVFSNIPFILISFLGLNALCNSKAYMPIKSVTREERCIYVVFFASIGLTGIGSSYYHINPMNQTLIWERLPMITAFTSLLSALIAERMSPKIGLWLLIPLTVSGCLSVIYWGYSEWVGTGDLRFYSLVQFLSAFYILLILWMFPASYSKGYYILYALLCSLIAKIFEFSDHFTYKTSWELVSGHTLKHIFMALTAYSIYLYLRERNRISS